MSPLPCILALALGLSAASQPALAGKAHVHGAARLDIGVEPQRVTLALELPMDSAVGFEREPRTEAERQKLDAALARLRDGAALFRIDPAAQCQPARAEARKTVEGSHADLDASWEFTCAAGAKAAFVEVRLFEAFPALSRIDVQSATARGQMKATLKRGSARVPLAR